MTTTIAGVAPLLGPRTLQLIQALNRCTVLVDRYGQAPGNPQIAYARASLLMDASAFHGACAAKIFPEWADRIAPDVESWAAQMHAVGMTWADPIVNLPWPEATLQSDPYAFATRGAQVAAAAAQIWGTGEPGAWQPELANADPPAQWVQDVYYGVLDFCRAIPIVGWLVEALFWLCGGIASWFDTWEPTVFATTRPEISTEMMLAATQQIAAVRVSLDSVLAQAKGAGWSQSYQRGASQLVTSKAAGGSAPSAATSAKASTARTVAVVALGTGAALALVWVLLA